jgi:peptidoglycan/LPS O-acetylase OafA/YrhL
MLHGRNKVAIVKNMLATFSLAAAFLVLSGFLLARPLLRRAR